MPLKLNSAGGGSVTIDTPSTASNFNLTVPAATGTVVTADASGNVGIGRTPTNFKLEIAGKQWIQDATEPKIFLGNTLSDYNSIFYDPATKIGYVSVDGTSTQLVFRTVNTERMRIDSSGNLLVGTTAPAGIEKVSIVFDNSSKVGTSYRCSSGTYTWAAINFLNVSATQVGYIYPNSNSTQYSTSSDYRLKENIALMTGALAKVQQLKPVTYQWKSDGSASQGFIAHELQAVVPECVTGEKDAVDAEGKPVYQGIDTSFLVATLTAAIQELNAKVDALQSELTELKGAA